MEQNTAMGRQTLFSIRVVKSIHQSGVVHNRNSKPVSVDFRVIEVAVHFQGPLWLPSSNEFDILRWPLVPANSTPIWFVQSVKWFCRYIRDLWLCWSETFSQINPSGDVIEFHLFSRVLRDSVSQFSVGPSVRPFIGRSISPSVGQSVGRSV